MKTNFTLAAVAALIVGGVGSAEANSISSAYLQLSDFKWTHTNGTEFTNKPSDNPHVVINAAGINSGSVNSELTGYATDASSEAPTILSGGEINIDSCAGSVSNCLAAPYGTIPTVPTNTFVYGSSSISGSVINVYDQNGLVSPAGVTATTLAQSSLIDNAIVAASTTKSGTNVAFDFNFNATGPATLLTTLSFNYDAKLFASIVSPFGMMDVADAGISWNLSLTRLAKPGFSRLVVLNWSPGELNQTLGVGASEDDALYEANGFLSKTATLENGASYRFTITHNASTTASRDVEIPEPDMLALLGVGLLGFGALKRKAA